MYVGRAGNVTHSVRDLLSDHIVRVDIAADYLHVNGRGQTEIQNLAHDIRWLEKELNSGKSKRQILAQLLYIIRSRMMVLLIQRNKNLGIGCAYRSTGAVRRVDRAERQADVVENRDQFVFGNLIPQKLLNFIAEPRRFLDSRSGTAAHVQAKDTCVHCGKEVLA